jgi:hypothetical protein
MMTFASRLACLLLLFVLIPTYAYASDRPSPTCEKVKIRAAGRYAACLARADIAPGRQVAQCEEEITRRFAKAERRGECTSDVGAADVSSFLIDVQALVLDSIRYGDPLPQIIEPTCEPSEVNLLDFEAWQREEGYWIGEYTFLGADGAPFVSGGWPYRYDDYRGFIHLEVDGSSISQRNVFLYPAQYEEDCTQEVDEMGVPLDVVGTGMCGVNGNEKTFSADQQASDCDGNLAGPFVQGPFTLATETRLLGDDSVLYQVRLFDQGPLVQNQLTTLPGDGTRVRTAQGFAPFLPPGLPTWSYSSYYRERKVSRDEFYAALAETREEYSILPSDYCAYGGGSAPSGVTCDEHFGESTAP